MLPPMAQLTPFIRRLITALALGLALTSSGCFEDHCAKLKNRVCNELKDKHRCKLMQSEQRMESLSGETCDEILKALKR